ncbi:hypothetical protein BaRGS_00031813 [Batillaria attramentaria]|uniref:Uncharacterized protein n=1 Tax=Batillaria attramentaria TaxID=370345 RepID=A0ABD0JQB9_9CAEN
MSGAWPETHLTTRTTAMVVAAVAMSQGAARLPGNDVPPDELPLGVQHEEPVHPGARPRDQLWTAAPWVTDDTETQQDDGMRQGVDQVTDDESVRQTYAVGNATLHDAHPAVRARWKPLLGGLWRLGHVEDSENYQDYLHVKHTAAKG